MAFAFSPTNMDSKFRISDFLFPLLALACWRDLDRREQVHKQTRFPVKSQFYSQAAVSNVTLWLELSKQHKFRSISQDFSPPTLVYSEQ